MEQEKQLDQKLTEISKEHKDVVDTAKALSISCNADLEMAVNFVQRIKGIRKRIDDFKSFFVKPFKDGVKKIELRIKPYSDELNVAERTAKGKMESYQLVLEKKRYEEEEKVKKSQFKTTKKITSPIPKEEKVSGLSFRADWDCEPIDEDKIPRVFSGVKLLIVDMKAARKLVKAGIRDIPGFRVFEKKTPVISSGPGGTTLTTSPEDDI